MNINLTPEQFKILIKVTYWSDWIVNGYKTTSDEEGKALDAFGQLMYSMAEEFGLGDWIAYDEETNYYYPTEKMQADLNDRIAEYEDYVMNRDQFN